MTGIRRSLPGISQLSCLFIYYSLPSSAPFSLLRRPFKTLCWEARPPGQTATAWGVSCTGSDPISVHAHRHVRSHHHCQHRVSTMQSHMLSSNFVVATLAQVTVTFCFHNSAILNNVFSNVLSIPTCCCCP